MSPSPPFGLLAWQVGLVVAWLMVIANATLMVVNWHARRRLRQATAECIVETERLRAMTAALTTVREFGEWQTWRCSACGFTGQYRAGPPPPGIKGFGFPCPHCGVRVDVNFAAEVS